MYANASEHVDEYNGNVDTFDLGSRMGSIQQNPSRTLSKSEQGWHYGVASCTMLTRVGSKGNVRELCMCTMYPLSRLSLPRVREAGSGLPGGWHSCFPPEKHISRCWDAAVAERLGEPRVLGRV